MSANNDGDSHLPIYDNAHGNGDNGSSTNAQPSLPTETNYSNLKSSATSTLSTGALPAPGSHPQSSRKHSHTHSMSNDSNNCQHQPTNSVPTSPNIKDQFFLEQQIKLTQLHQLQQLQQHIFQQQMALISGQSTSILPGSTSPEFVGIGGVGSIGNIGHPVDLNTVAVSGGGVRPLDQNLTQSQNQQRLGGDTQNRPRTFSGLPTPAPSGEIRPMDYNTTSAPMMNLLGSLNLQYIEPLPNSMIPSPNSSNRMSSVSKSPAALQAYPNPSQLNVSHRLGHRHSSSLSSASVHPESHHQNHASYPSSPLVFNPKSTASPTFSPMNISTSHSYHPPSLYASSHAASHLSAAPVSHPPSSTSTPISAPERVAFTIYGGNHNRSGSAHATPHLQHSNSVHTSPNVLGSGIGSINRNREIGQMHQLLDDLDQDISPLTSPWLGATAVSTSGSVANAAFVQNREHSRSSPRRKSISGNKRTASESGDETGAWSWGGTNKNSRKRPLFRNDGRIGSLTGSAGTSGVGNEREKANKNDDGKGRSSTSPLGRNSTSPVNEVTSSLDPSARNRDGASGGSSHTSASPLGPTTGSKRPRRGSRSTSSAGTPLLRSTPSTTNMLSPMSPMSPSFVGGGAARRNSRVRNGPALNSPSPVDLALEVTQSQDGRNERNMPPPPPPRSGVDTDMNPTSVVDDPSGQLRHGMLGMGAIGFDGMILFDEGMGGLGGMSGMEIGVGGLDGMDMGGIGGVGSMNGMEGMGMDEMGMDMGMGVNMGGMGGFGSGHEHSQHRREELAVMGMDYGRAHDEEGINLSSPTSSVGRTSAGNPAMRSATHLQNQSELHTQPHSEYQSAQTQQHSQPSYSFHTQQAHHLQTQQSQHQAGQPNPASHSNQQQPIMPVATPSSILNLGKLGSVSGGRLGSASTAPITASSSVSGTGTTTRAKKTTKSTKEGGAASRRRSMTSSLMASGTAVGVSPGLKPLRPAGCPSESTLPSPALSGSVGPSPSNTKAPASNVSSATHTGSTGGGATTTPALSPADLIGVGVIRQPKRTHRDAEQRRRNSQKQVIDELRRLLPPIALPSDSVNDSEPTSPSGPTPGMSPFFFQPTATLLPGGLPPRGPPKAGGEGPNKNVSKLQVLLCGNEYIKLLKARVERRDDEIGRLRTEVRRLRGLRDGGNLMGVVDVRIEEEEDVDLEKDLDAVERLNTLKEVGIGRGGGGDDAMDEDDEDGDD